jgi:hypothetical protein
MFAFDLPKWAAFPVNLPTGGEAVFVHIGGGRFLSRIPPLGLAGVAPAEGQGAENLPLEWDSSTLPADKEACMAVFTFDAAAGAAAVEAAAAAGDVFAAQLLEQIREGERMYEAQQAVGMMQ